MIIRIGTGIMLGLVLLIAGCSLTVDKTTLDFGDKETSMTFILKTSGVLTWSISCEHDWVTVVPTQGISNQAARTIEVIVDTTGLGLGDYEAALSISNNWRLPYKEVLIRMSVGEEN